MNLDFKELLLAFNAHNVEYLIVGAHALAAHGHVRATKDLDVWVRPDESNAQNRLETLFGGVPAFVISRHHLITNKKTAARLQDLADVQQLELDPIRSDEI